MINRNLAEVRARLEKVAMTNSGDNLSPLEKYEAYEQLAIAILDGEFMDYPDDVLEAYLMEYLERKRTEFHLDLNR